MHVPLIWAGFWNKIKVFHRFLHVDLGGMADTFSKNITLTATTSFQFNCLVNFKNVFDFNSSVGLFWACLGFGKIEGQLFIQQEELFIPRSDQGMEVPLKEWKGLRFFQSQENMLKTALRILFFYLWGFDLL